MSFGIKNFHEFTIVALIKIGAYTCLFIFWKSILKLLKLLDKSEMSLSMMMTIGCAGGIVFALSEEAICWIVQFHYPIGILNRTLAYAIPSTFWLPAGSVIAKNIDRYRRLRTDVRETLLQQESVKFARTLALAEYEKKIEEEIQENLKLTTSQASEILNSIDGSRRALLPEFLRVISGEYFSLTARSMPQSNLLANLGVAKWKNQLAELTSALKDSINTRPLNPLWFATMVAITMFLPLGRTHTTLVVFEMVSLTFALTYLLQKAQVASFAIFESGRLLILVVTSATNVILPLAIITLLWGDLVQNRNRGAFLFLILILTGLGHLAQAGLLRVEDFRAESASELAKLRRDEREVNLLFLRITQDWARHIHGSITSKLESAAIEIDHALKEDDQVGVARAIERVNEYLKSESGIKRADQSTLLEEVRERARAWEGLIEIEVKSSLNEDGFANVSIRDAGLCVEEAILNAVRHGECRSIEIELLETEFSLRLLCSDDGVGFIGKPTGYGSQIFTKCTQGNWNLSRDTSRGLTLLTLEFRKS